MTGELVARSSDKRSQHPAHGGHRETGGTHHTADKHVDLRLGQIALREGGGDGRTGGEHQFQGDGILPVSPQFNDAFPQAGGVL